MRTSQKAIGTVFRNITIVKLFIRDWNLHLYSVKSHVTYLEAAGHLHYSKPAQVYFTPNNHATRRV